MGACGADHSSLRGGGGSSRVGTTSFGGPAGPSARAPTEKRKGDPATESARAQERRKNNRFSQRFSKRTPNGRGSSDQAAADGATRGRACPRPRVRSLCYGSRGKTCDGRGRVLRRKKENASAWEPLSCIAASGRIGIHGERPRGFGPQHAPREGERGLPRVGGDAVVMFVTFVNCRVLLEGRVVAGAGEPRVASRMGLAGMNELPVLRTHGVPHKHEVRGRPQLQRRAQHRDEHHQDALECAPLSRQRASGQSVLVLRHGPRTGSWRAYLDVLCRRGPRRQARWVREKTPNGRAPGSRNGTRAAHAGRRSARTAATRSDRRFGETR
jgi:hypothetical protein